MEIYTQKNKQHREQKKCEGKTGKTQTKSKAKLEPNAWIVNLTPSMPSME